jgi:2-methylcitrate dehydratase MmgE/PrpD-like protein
VLRRRTKLVLLDTLGVMLAGAQRPEVAARRRRLAPNFGTGATIFATHLPSTDPGMAAMLNAIAARSIELTEGLRGVQHARARGPRRTPTGSPVCYAAARRASPKRARRRDCGPDGKTS